jgi:hypothetical protein
MKQATLDRIRAFNKHVTNKFLIHIAGKRFGHFAVLTHYGRKSGRRYRIPIIAEPIENGFVMALTYGLKVDWYANVKARGHCSLFWKGRDYDLVKPEFMDVESALMAFPAILRSGLGRAGIQYFLKLEVQP